MASDSDSEWEAEGGEQLEEEDDGDDESFHEDDEDEDGFAARHRNSEDGDDDTKKPAAATSVVRIGGFKPKTKKELVENTEDGAAAAGTAAAEDGASCSTTTCGNKNSRSDNRKRLRRVDFDAEGETDEIDHLPTHQRITVAGGYSHTKNSRLKISQANKGKSPWNKGKNRSETAKAKISAGVRARNHAVLLVKLSKLNMTAEEWFAKKRQIKLLRERVRKSKVAAKKHEENKTTEMKNVALQQEFDDLVQELETDDDGNDVEINNEGKEGCGVADTIPMDATSERNTRPVAEEIASKDDRKKHNNATLGVVGQEFETTKSDMRVLPAVSMKQPTIPIFARDFRWTPHIFDSKKSSANSGVANISYDMLCPHGGPGGLVCCDSCTASYAKYLTKTVTDMETQKMQRAGDEVKELLDFTRQAKHRLTQTIRVARRKPVPIRCINSNLSVAHEETNNDNNNAGPSSALEAPPPPVVVQEVLPPVNVWTTAGPSMEFSEYMPTEEV